MEFKKYSKEEIDTAIMEIEECKNSLKTLSDNDLISPSEVIKIQSRLVDDVIDIVHDMYAYCKRELKEEVERELLYDDRTRT